MKIYFCCLVASLPIIRTNNSASFKKKKIFKKFKLAIQGVIEIQVQN